MCISELLLRLSIGSYMVLSELFHAFSAGKFIESSELLMRLSLYSLVGLLLGIRIFDGIISRKIHGVFRALQGVIVTFNWVFSWIFYEISELFTDNQLEYFWAIKTSDGSISWKTFWLLVKSIQGLSELSMRLLRLLRTYQNFLWSYQLQNLWGYQIFLLIYH